MSLTSNPAVHIDILRLMVHEGQYDPMEDGIYGSIMHTFQGSSIVYQWLLDQEDFFIDFEQLSPFGDTIASHLIFSIGWNCSASLEAVITRGSDVVLGGDTSLAHVVARSIPLCVDDLDYPKRIKVLWDVGVDFHALEFGRTPLATLLQCALDYIPGDKTMHELCSVEQKSVPKPPTGSTRRVIDYDILDPSLNTKCRPRLPKTLWQTSRIERKPSLLEMKQRFLDAWMELLLEAGLDIADYGRREERLHPEGYLELWGGEARIIFEYGSHVNGCRIHVTEVWVFDPYDFDSEEEAESAEDDDREEEATSAEASAMPCSWDFDDE